MHIVSQITATLILAISPAGDSTTSRTLEELPTGNYYYEASASSRRVRNQAVLLRKVGRVVVGIEFGSRARNPCFKGFVEQNRIVDATRVYPPYAPDSDWEQQRGDAINLDRYRRLEGAMREADDAALQRCLRVFSE